MDFPIDFVVTWVDDNDDEWNRKKSEYSSKQDSSNNGMSSKKAYRDWETFNYWFRGVEKFAPWVNRVYLVTDNQKPKWLNVKNTKLTLVNHTDFIPKEYLPVFNSNAIEANIHRISGLSEHFVVFNDDMFITSPIEPTDFFDNNGTPKGRTSIKPIIPDRYGTANFQVNDMEIINYYFSKKEIIKKAKLLSKEQGLKNILRTVLYRTDSHFLGFSEDHMPYALLKSTYMEVWDKEKSILEKTAQSRFREPANTNIWLFKYWQFASGNISVRNEEIGKLFSLDWADDVKLWELIPSGKYKIMCINDGFDIKDEAYIKENLNNSFKKLLPEKSSFEI